MAVRAPYRSPLRERQAAATRDLIVSSCIGLMEAGREITYTAVARAAGVQERTVFRYFPSKQDLETAVWTWIVERHTHADFSAANEEELIAAMRQSFAGFDVAAPLIRGMLHSRQGLEIRLRQQPARRAMFDRCITTTWPGVPGRLRTEAAATLQVLYSAQAWEQLQDFWGMSGAAAANATEFAMRAVFNTLREHARAASRRRNK